MKSYVIHLLRHGLSEGNLHGQYVGRTDSPLSGRQEALLRLKTEGSTPKRRRISQVRFPGVLKACVCFIRRQTGAGRRASGD